MLDDQYSWTNYRAIVKVDVCALLNYAFAFQKHYSKHDRFIQNISRGVYYWKGEKGELQFANMNVQCTQVFLADKATRAPIGA